MVLFAMVRVTSFDATTLMAKGDNHMPRYERIKDLREDRDLTQKQLADALFMQLTQYRRYESGEREVSLELAVTLARLYDVPLDFLAGVSNTVKVLPENALEANELLLLNRFRSLNRADRARLLEISKVFTEHK